MSVPLTIMGAEHHFPFLFVFVVFHILSIAEITKQSTPLKVPRIAVDCGATTCSPRVGEIGCGCEGPRIQYQRLDVVCVACRQERLITSACGSEPQSMMTLLDSSGQSLLALSDLSRCRLKTLV